MNMEDLYRLLRAGHVQAQGMVDTVPDPLLVLDQGLRIQTASRAFFETFKVDRFETIGRPLHELGNGQWDIPELRRLLLEVIPKASAVVDFRVEHDFPDLGRRSMLVTARTLHHPDGGGHTMLVSIVDVTEQDRRDAARDTLFGELQHRMKNLLAVTQAIARLTETKGRSADEFRDDFLGRFGALVASQDLAFGAAVDPSLTTLVERILAPFNDQCGSVSVADGSAVTLGPRTIMSLSLVLHELATNAAKYGGLSVPGGKVEVAWESDEPAGELRIHWREQGGAEASPAAGGGQGTQLIDSVIGYTLEGRVERNHHSQGLEVEILIPAENAAR